RGSAEFGGRDRRISRRGIARGRYHAGALEWQFRRTMRQAARAPQFEIARSTRRAMIQPRPTSRCHSEERPCGPWQTTFARVPGQRRGIRFFLCPFAKSGSLIARSHEDMQASFLGMTTKWLPSAPIIVAVLCALAVALAAPAPARATIRYEIALTRPAQHQFH